MLNGIENSEQTNQPKIFRDIILPGWESKMLHEQGFTELELNKLRRKGIDKNEYLVYFNKNEFKAIEAETATLAMETSENTNPHKIIHSYCRLDDIIKLENLEFIAKEEDSGVQTEAAAENADTSKTETGETTQTTPPSEEPKPEETSS
jgi:hypothetical protein